MVYEQDSTPFLFEDESDEEEEKVDEVEKGADDEEGDEAVE